MKCATIGITEAQARVIAARYWARHSVSAKPPKWTRHAHSLDDARGVIDYVLGDLAFFEAAEAAQAEVSR